MSAIAEIRDPIADSNHGAELYCRDRVSIAEIWNPIADSNHEAELYCRDHGLNLCLKNASLRALCE